MRIQHNIMAMSAYRNYTNNVSAMKKNLEKLSSGYKINRAGDDAAGLAISEKMRAQITGLETAQKNAKDGISLVQTAEGALTEVHDMLNRMVELATQSANGTYDNTTDRAQMQKEVNQLLDEINRIADSSNFNGINLLDGSLGLNSEAVSGIKYLDATGNVAAKDLGSAAYSVTGHHGSNAKEFSKPSVTIDLGDTKIALATASATSVSFTIHIGSVALSATATGVSGGIATVGDIVKALTTKYTATATAASATAGGWVNIGGAAYQVTGSAGALKLELKGVLNAAGSAIATVSSNTNKELFTTSMASAFTAKINPGATVTISVAASAGTVKTNNTYIHGVTDYNPAVAEGAKNRWGADITLTASVAMVEGNTLEIDGKTFTIKFSATAAKSTITGANATSGNSDIIIATKNAATAAAQLKELMDVIEGANAGRFKVSTKEDKIHFDARASQDNNVSDINSEADLTKLVSFKSAAQSAKNPAVTFNAKEKFTKGDVLKVGDKTYIYGASSAKATRFDSISDLKSKLATDFGASKVATEANGSAVKFTVYASSATAAAPMIQGRGLTLQIGDTSDSFNQLNVAVQDMHAVSLGINNLSIANEVDAQAAIAKIKDAINTVSDVRGTLGATQNRLDHTINNLSVMTENIQDAESTIRDVDVAEEMMAYTKNNILIQSAQAMLAQANQVPQGVLQLLQ